MSIFARSITRGSFIPKGNLYELAEDARVSLKEYANQVLGAYNNMMNGVLVCDYSVDTEQDGTYDQLREMIIHWRDDGWVDVLVFANFEEAEHEMERLAEIHYGDA